MENNFPKFEDLKYNNADERLDVIQDAKFDLIQRIQDIFNLSVNLFTDPITKNIQKTSLSSFLNELYNTANLQIQNSCNGLLFDNFIAIADMCFVPLKSIIENPSTKLIRVEEKIPIEKLKNSNSKTIRWLAQRPGRTIQEKTAPQYKVATQSTKFTTNTIENEMSMYLYNKIYDFVLPRISKVDCEACLKDENLSCKKMYKKMKQVSLLKTLIKKSDLKEVAKKKHTTQNNKLMCDKFYKTVWDGCKKIDFVEKNLEKQWAQLQNNSEQLLFWMFIGHLISFEKVYIDDIVGKPNFDKDGKLTFDNNIDNVYGVSQIKLYVENGEELILLNCKLEGSKILIENYSFATELNDTINEATSKTFEVLNDSDESEYTSLISNNSFENFDINEKTTTKAIAVEKGNQDRSQNSYYSYEDGILTIKYSKKTKNLGNFACKHKKPNQIIIDAGIETIQANAFKKYHKVKKIFIPPSVKKIETNALVSSKKTKIVAEQGSYAEQFAMQNGYSFQVSEQKEASKQDDKVKVQPKNNDNNEKIIDDNQNSAYDDYAFVLPTGLDNTQPKEQQNQAENEYDFCTKTLTIKENMSYESWKTLLPNKEVEHLIFSKGLTSLMHILPANKTLIDIILPSSIEVILTGTFTNYKNALFLVSENSYAEKFVKENNYTYKII